MDHLNSKMMALILFIALITPLRATEYIREHYDTLLIDCGANSSTGDGSLDWHADQQFTKTGENILLPSNNTKFQMNTLRYFPRGHKNCYKLPFYSGREKYIFRAAFLYGNYDSHKKPPSFGLEIDGRWWTDVTTSMSDEPVYHELLYFIPQQQVKMCLVRTRDDEFPFISSLEARPLNLYTDYTFMRSNTLLNLHSRFSYGANQSFDEGMNSDTGLDLPRTWESKQMSDYLNIYSTNKPYGYLTGENRPPEAVMFNAIQAQRLTDSIYLTIDFSPQISSQAYFVLYFMDPINDDQSMWNKTCKVEIYIDYKLMAVTDVPTVYTWLREGATQYRVISLFPVTVGVSATVTISAAQDSALPPLLNAMEIYWQMDVPNAAVRLLNFTPLLFIIFLPLIHVIFM